MLISPKYKPIVIDLFSGAGGPSEGFKQSGFNILASVEMDRYFTETQIFNHSKRKKYPTNVINADLNETEFAVSVLENAVSGIEIDLIIGGPPCRGFSSSNTRNRTLNNPLNFLFEKFISIVEKFKPKIVVLENVSGMNRFENGYITDLIIGSLKDIGYYVERESLNSVFYGVPQKRNRLFFIGSRISKKIIFPEKVIQEKENFITVWEALSDLPSLENGNNVDELPYTINDNLSSYPKLMRNNSNGFVKNNLVSKNSELVLERYNYIKQGENWQSIPDELMQNYKDKNLCHSGIYKRLIENKPSITISNYRKNMLIHPREDRGLSVREAARLQSFPDNFIFLGSISSQQQQVANAVPPLLAKAVAKAVKKVL